jgi:hypothetical protein
MEGSLPKDVSATPPKRYQTAASVGHPDDTSCR